MHIHQIHVSCCSTKPPVHDTMRDHYSKRNQQLHEAVTCSKSLRSLTAMSFGRVDNTDSRFSAADCWQWITDKWTALKLQRHFSQWSTSIEDDNWHHLS